MHNGHPSSSSRKAALLVMTSLLGMAGCSGGQHLLGNQSAFLEEIGFRKTQVVEPLMTARVKPLPLKPRIEPASDLQIASAQSSWCDSLRETASAQALILRSPTLSGSVTDAAKVSLNLGLSASSFVKANLMEQAAQERCHKYLAENGLQKLVFVSPQNLTAAGYRAKADTIFKQAGDLAKLRKKIDQEMASGAIDREKAAAISILIDRLLAEGNNAKSQADRRISEHMIDGKSADRLSADLLVAEGNLDSIESHIRTADAMDVSVTAGWDDDLNSAANTDAFSGKLSFTMHLGALDPRRFEHERLATAAKMRAIQNEEGGAVWQIGALRRAHERAIAGLEESQLKLEQAMKETNHLLAVLGSVPQPEFEGARLNARYELIKLKADKAGVVGSLAEIRTNLNRLRHG